MAFQFREKVKAALTCCKNMEPQVKAALILGGAIIITVAMWIYFNPF